MERLYWLTHQVVHDNYLSKHEDPTEINNTGGPPMMNTAVTKMLEDLGVEEDMIDYDDLWIIFNVHKQISNYCHFNYFFSMGNYIVCYPNDKELYLMVLQWYNL